MKGSFDTGDPLTTNLYVGNINPKVQRRRQSVLSGFGFQSDYRVHVSSWVNVYIIILRIISCSLVSREPDYILQVTKKHF